MLPVVASETFSHTAHANATVADVWATLDKPETWESIGGVDRVTEPTVDDQGRLRGFSFDVVAAGKPYKGKATPRERVEGELMSWNVQNSEVRGVTSVALSTNGATTEITVTLQVEGKSFMSRMFFPVIAGAIGNGLPRAVDEFAGGFGG